MENKEQTQGEYNASVQGVRSYSRHKTNAFIEKTFDLLEKNRFPDAVAWDDSGSMIVIKDLGNFVNIVLSNVFNHQNFQSFVRQLNLYNFKKKKYKQYQYVYSHPHFQRGKRDKLGLVLRQPIYKNKMAKAINNKDSSEDKEILGSLEEQQQIQNTVSKNSSGNNLLPEVEFENRMMRDRICQLQSEIQAKEDHYRKSCDRNLELQYRIKLQATDAAYLMKELNERKPANSFEIFKAQEVNNLYQTIGKVNQNNMLLKIGKSPFPGNSDSIYVPVSSIDDRIERNPFVNDFYHQPQMFRQNQFNVETDEIYDNYNLRTQMLPQLRETQDSQYPIVIPRLEENKFSNCKLFLNSYPENR